MTHNHEIPFSPEPPKEAGDYKWKTNPIGDVRLVLITESEGTLGTLYFESFGYYRYQLVRVIADNPDCLWCKLIPSTALEAAEKRVRELEAKINSAVIRLGPLCNQTIPSTLTIRDILFDLRIV